MLRIVCHKIACRSVLILLHRERRFTLQTIFAIPTPGQHGVVNDIVMTMLPLRRSDSSCVGKLPLLIFCPLFA